MMIVIQKAVEKQDWVPSCDNRVNTLFLFSFLYFPYMFLLVAPNDFTVSFLVSFWRQWRGVLAVEAVSLIVGSGFAIWQVFLFLLKLRRLGPVKLRRQ